MVLHVADEVTSQVTTSLLAKVVDVNVDEFVPTIDPFRFHCYTGVTPALTAFAVKVTD